MAVAQIVKFPHFEREALLRSASFDRLTRTIDVVWMTGAAVRRRTVLGEAFDEELVVQQGTVRLDRLNAGAPFLDMHNAASVKSVLGVVVGGSARLESGKGVARIQLSGRAEIAGIVQDIEDGVLRNISVAYRIHTIEKVARRGDVPLHRIVDWEPWEISAVSISADTDAQVRAAAPPQLHECRVLTDREIVREIQRRMAKRQYEMSGSLPRL